MNKTLHLRPLSVEGYYCKELFLTDLRSLYTEEEQSELQIDFIKGFDGEMPSFLNSLKERSFEGWVEKMGASKQEEKLEIILEEPEAKTISSLAEINIEQLVKQEKTEVDEKSDDSDDEDETGESPFWSLLYYKTNHKWTADNDSDEEDDPENPIHDLLILENSAMEKQEEKKEEVEDKPKNREDNPWLDEESKKDSYFVIVNKDERTIRAGE